MTEAPCKVGDRIRLIKMGDDDPCPIEPGTTGTVIAVAHWPRDKYQIGVQWDVRRSLGLVWPVDQIEVI